MSDTTAETGSVDDGKVTDDLSRLRACLDETAARGEARLPPEPQLSEALGISRGRLRTLLRKLENEGAIWRHVGKGTFIGARETVEVRPTSLPSFSVGDIFAARMLLEPQLAAEAAIHANAENLVALDLLLEEMARSRTYLQWKRLDERLHREIARASNNTLLLMLYDTLRTQIRETLDVRLEQVFGGKPGPHSATDDEHGRVIQAIRTHDPMAAETAMREHLTSVRTKLFGIRWTA